MVINYTDLTDKCILVTGASSGIGKACAIYLSSIGAKLILVARNENRLQETMFQLKGSGHSFLSINLDEVASIEEALVEGIPKEKKIYGLVHAAGIESTVPFTFTKPLAYQDIFNINVISGFELARIIIKKYKDKDSGSFVFISSIMSIVGASGKIPYSSSKGALVSGVKSMALEMARNNYRANCVSPAMVNTEMTLKMMKDVPEEAFEQIRKQHPLGFGNPVDVANATAFLLSKASAWITGTNLVIDGGYSAH